MLNDQRLIKEQNDSNEYPFHLLESSYKFVKILGEGAYGQVICVENKFGEKFAVKRLNYTRKIEGLDTFCLREIAILQELEHPNIIKLVNYYYCWKGNFFFNIFNY